MRKLGRPISAVVGSSLSRAEVFAAAHDIPFAADDVDDLLPRDQMDAAYIGSVNHLPGPHTIAAAAAGMHVLCEKPVAMDLPQAWAGR